ncbi:hypothetical protein VNO78_02853 [Psophocarpus tetragonolobus]|uniref:Uncharacterized protein n=1 Tax=Psophocarpus tetragonolobus TaxID=3891 RepID=A0AAN9XV28_PSOTE
MKKMKGSWTQRSGRNLFDKVSFLCEGKNLINIYVCEGLLGVEKKRVAIAQFLLKAFQCFASSDRQWERNSRAKKAPKKDREVVNAIVQVFEKIAENGEEEKLLWDQFAIFQTKKGMYATLIAQMDAITMDSID